MQSPVDWRRRARQMRAQGHDTNAIAIAVDKAPSTVREALRGLRRGPAGLGAGANLVEAHVARVPRRVVADQAALMSAARAFANNEITKDELMARITR